MISLKKIFLSLFLLIFLLPSLSSQNSVPKGISLCDNIYSFFSDLNFNLEKQEIIASGDNTFPYNIVLHFDRQNPYDQNNLIICIKMESAYKNQNLVFDLISDLIYRNFNSTLLFIYGTDVDSEGLLVVDGSKSFLNNLDADKNYTAFILDLDSKKNTVQTGSEGQTSPSWLINSTYDAYINERLSQDLPVYYLSQLSKLNFNTNPVFSSFAQHSIPVISAGFNLETVSQEKVSRVVSAFLDDYTKNKNSDNDYHSLMFRIGNKKFWLSEYTIIKILIVMTFLSLAFVFVLAYLNSSIRSAVWKEIRKNWYTIPVTFILTIGGWYFAKLIYMAATKGGQTAQTAFGLPVLAIIIGFALISAFYLMELLFHKKSYGERSIDLLIVMTTFLNECIFCLADISLFPLFLFLCLCSILLLIFHKNWIHIVFFLIFILIYIPYINLLYISNQVSGLKQFLASSNIAVFAYALCVLPIFIMWLRILIAIQNKFSKRRVFVITICTAYFVFMIVCLIVNKVSFSDPEAKIDNSQVEVVEDTNGQIINISYNDKNIFENIYRTISISLNENVKCMELNLTDEDGNPVLYSENYYQQTSANQSNFLIPVYPPKNTTFSYGTETVNGTINVKVLVEENNTHKIYTKTISAGGK